MKAGEYKEGEIMPVAYRGKNYWHVVLFNHNKCVPDTIRRSDPGRLGHAIRQSCIKASTKKWATQSWLLENSDVKVVKGRGGIRTLQALDISATRILQSVRSNIGRVRIE